MINVLIVEDDKMVANINHEFVNKLHDFQVVGVFHDCLDALGFLLHHDVDLILLDIYMKNYSGMDFLREIRRRHLLVDVIMVTVANDTTHIEEALKLGIIDYLIKPFQFERLKQALEHYITHKNMLEKNSSMTQLEIDQLLRIDQLKHDLYLSKGIQEETLLTIKNVLLKYPYTYLNVETIAKETEFSKVTIRRYLNHLCERGIAISHMNYSTGGRPSIEYILNQDEYEQTSG